jgi:aspartyl-tRNA(Asn)/glutamyl-tRNA(Gln) amidotransferase subunit B
MTAPAATKYEAVIGLEVHAQVSTKSKMFCGCPADYHDSEPNTHVCPVCAGMPGVLPVINRAAVEATVRTGLALNCEIPDLAKFDRKNYPYPDLMKGYQISQYDLPFCVNGWLEIDLDDGGTKRIGITRVHLEEDTARSAHKISGAGEEFSLIDMNRSGVPLMEIVSEPDVRLGREARLYLMKLQQILRYLGASRANLEEGNMRCEPNVSIRPEGSKELGNKVELKNLNSFRAVELGIDYEIERQRRLLEANERVVQETRGWREDQQITVSQRSKEVAEEYRYFPEPDLPPLGLRREQVDHLRASLPELPDAKLKRFVSQYGLTHYEANLLTSSIVRADFYERAVGPVQGDGDVLRRRAKSVANWMLGDFARLLNANDIDVSESKVTPEALHELVVMIEEGTITTTGAKDVFERMFASGESPQGIVEAEGLTQISAGDELGEVVAGVIASNPKPVADYRAGKEAALKALVGLVMRETRGRANPGAVQEILREKLTQA